MSKKKFKQLVETKLILTFEDLKDQMGSKKFNKNIKKAGKSLLAGLRHIPNTNSGLKDNTESSVSS